VNAGKGASQRVKGSDRLRTGEQKEEGGKGVFCATADIRRVLGGDIEKRGRSVGEVRSKAFMETATVGGNAPKAEMEESWGGGIAALGNLGGGLASRQGLRRLCFWEREGADKGLTHFLDSVKGDANR